MSLSLDGNGANSACTEVDHYLISDSSSKLQLSIHSFSVPLEPIPIEACCTLVWSLANHRVHVDKQAPTLTFTHFSAGVTDMGPAGRCANREKLNEICKDRENKDDVMNSLHIGRYYITGYV